MEDLYANIKRKISMEDQSFNCSEQAYQYIKCITCKREEAAHKIMLLSLPREIKAKGDKIDSTPKWEGMKLTKMEEIVTQKFLQNPALRKKLCDIGDHPLYEGTSNQFWGCGLRLNSRHWSSGMIPGKNHMGQILMKVREKMRDYDAKLKRNVSASAAAGGPSQLINDENKPPAAPMHFNTSTALDTTLRDESHHEQMDTVIDQSSNSTSAEVTHQGASDQQSFKDDSELLNSSVISSSNKSENTSFRDFTTNHEFDICKVNSWKLPTVKRNTKEWIEKQRARGLLKRRRSDKHDKPEQQVYHSTPNSHSPPQRKRISRSFVNTNYQNQLRAEHGYDLESTYKRAMASYNKHNITDRKNAKN